MNTTNPISQKNHLLPSLALRLSCCLWIVFTLFSCSIRKQQPKISGHAPKREMRAIWWPTVWRNDYTLRDRLGIEDLVEKRLDLLQKSGFNTVVFQVRSECDAMYRSAYEPYSRFYTGEQGRYPLGGGDMLSFMINACHKRGMQLHAWINPYRAAVGYDKPTSPYHISRQKPEWIIRYDKALYLNPALKEVRNYVCQVVKDIVMHYDIDALHIDDYFYPYPVGNTPFPDEKEYINYTLTSKQPLDKESWRRENVNLLVKDIKQTLLQTKPWVTLGISPFGIYRNKKSHPIGSETSGLEGYSALYADVLHWAYQGWVDYIAPQIYWNKGNQDADYDALLPWWEKHTPSSVLLYIGQDVKRTQESNQLSYKIDLARKLSSGNIFWPGEEIWNNYRSITDQLSKSAYQSLALVPSLEKGKPQRIQQLTIQPKNNEFRLSWNAFIDEIDPEAARFFVVYIAVGRKPDIRSGRDIFSISSDPFIKISSNQVPYKKKIYFAVTSVDRLGRESKPTFLAYTRS